MLSEVPFLNMKTLLLAAIKERFYWEKNTDKDRQGWMSYRLYDNLYVYENYFENLEKMQQFMIDKLSAQYSCFDCYQFLHNARISKRNRKARLKLQQKYALKFKRKPWWAFR